MNKLYCMCGVAGSGKSYFISTHPDFKEAVVLSSDDIREELWGDASIQNAPDKVFKLLYHRAEENLSSGKDVVIDSTMLSMKNRRCVCERFAAYKKVCIVIATSYEDCVMNNLERERHVPLDVIKRQFSSFMAPWYDEGWDEIQVYLNSNWMNVVDTVCEKMEGFNQDNPHHALTLDEHCKKCASYLCEDPCLYSAAELHDVGKIFTKSWDKKHPEVAHYYSHCNWGAYYSYFFPSPSSEFAIRRAALIGRHMEPYFEGYYKSSGWWGEDIKEQIVSLHAADIMAH